MLRLMYVKITFIPYHFPYLCRHKKIKIWQNMTPAYGGGNNGSSGTGVGTKLCGNWTKCQVCEAGRGESTKIIKILRLALAIIWKRSIIFAQFVFYFCTICFCDYSIFAPAKLSNWIIDFDFLIWIDYLPERQQFHNRRSRPAV